MARRAPAVRDTRDRILECALAVFGETGYAVATLDDVAARAGLTKGAVYYYFRDKRDLALDLQQRLVDRLRREAAAAYDTALDVGTNLKRTFAAFLVALEDAGQARFLLRDSWAIPDLDVGGRAAHEASIAPVRDLLAAAMRSGRIPARDPEVVARVILAAFAEATLLILTTGRQEPAVEAVHHVVDAFTTPQGSNGARNGATPAGRRSQMEGD